MDDPWLTTYSGRHIFFIRPSKDDICIEDIAHGLSNICRYVGQCSTFYSVAEHSVRMADIMTKRGYHDQALLALLHDSPEAYISDMHSDFKKLLPLYMEVEERLLGVILDKYHVRCDSAHMDKVLVKKVDTRIRTPEVHRLFNGVPDSEFTWKLLEFDYRRIHPWSPRKAERKFLKMFRKLYSDQQRRTEYAAT